MKQGWEIKRLEEIAANIPYPIGDGDHGQIKPQNYSTSGIPYIRVGDMGWGEFIPKNMVHIPEDVHKQNLKSKLIPGDILLAKTGATIGKCCIIPDTINEANTTSSVGKITVDQKKVLPRWILLFFLTPDFLKFIWSISNRAAQPGFNNRDIKLFEIPLPPLPEQQRIVSILDEAFATIAKAKANAEQNLKNAKELFESYLQGVFEDGNWEQVKLSELAKDITDGDHMPPPKSKEGFPFITISNINKQNHQIDFSDTFKVPQEYFDNLKANRKPKKGDVLYTVTGSYGIPVLIEDDFEFCFQRHIGLIRPNENVSSKWLYYWILSPQAFFQANDTATGTAQKTVSLTALRSFVLPKMTLKEQKVIVQKLDALSTETKKLEVIYQQKINDLEELKKSVLQKAFSGELKTEKVQTI